MKLESANISIIFLGLILVISFTAFAIQRDSVFIAKLKANDLHAYKRNEEMRHAALKENLVPHPNQPNGLFCDTICNLSQTNPPKLPLLNYNLIFQTPTDNNSYIVQSNLDSTTDISINGPAIFAAAGYLNMQAQLKIKDQVIIIAGGDLYIKEILADGLASLTLLSATGNIEVESITGINQAAAFSSKTISIPILATLDPTPLQGLELESLVIGQP